jgi:predicted glycosyltransferase
VFFYVQHLLGTGHIKRAALLTDAMRARGMDVHMVSGGIITPDLLDVSAEIQLPALRAKDQSFSTLVDESGKEVDVAWKNERCRILLDHYKKLEPDIVVIETFPFGRRKFRFELIPLLNEIHRSTPKPPVVCSVRDVVQARSPKRIAETVELLRTRFDHIMVHGDPDIVRFEASFPAVEKIRRRLYYTGYVAPPRRTPEGMPGRNEILVSGGGGAVSAGLLAAAIKARPLSRLNKNIWRILVGPNIPQRIFDTLKAGADEGVVVERNRTDFALLLRNCTISVSQCGYNTAIGLIQASVRSLVVPFEGSGETEQLLRARKLAQRGLVQLLTETELTPGSLARAIDLCSSQPPPEPTELNLDGAARSARFVSDIWLEHTGN